MNSYAVRAGMLVDVQNGEMLPDHAVVVSGDRIETVEPWSPSRHGAYETLDLTDHVVTPGLIDLHTHLIGELESGGFAPFLTGSAARNALHGVRNASVTLRAGFTTVRDVGTFRAFVDCDLRDAIEAGICEGPRMVCAGAYVGTSHGGGEITDLAPDIPLPPEFRTGVADSVDEVRRVVRTIAHRGADVIKLMATGAVLTRGTVPGVPEYSQDEIRAAVDEAALYGLYVAAHAHGAEGILRAVRAGVRSVEHGTTITDEVIDAFLQHGTYYVPTTFLMRWITDQPGFGGYSDHHVRRITDVHGTAMRGLRDAVEAGVRIAYGTDAIVYPHGLNAGQLVDLVAAGMTPLDAIRSATVVAAECLGRDDIGVLAPGRLADLVAVRADGLDPVDRFGEVDVVIKGGVPVKGWSRR
ncbi:amidohydrolase family protein [Streptomyces sp. NPDC002680]|uniref:metal-dependent hydrolase family protein n=1 Tax=Streptomyces sp. NPDC002680 TaxID=3364659 RepID=UPI00368448DA